MLLREAGAINVIGDKFQLYFIENMGMAFGMEFGGDYGKLALSLFRIVAVTAIGIYLFKIPKEAARGFKISVALIFAGAIGNIIDSAFYGIIFNESGVDRVAEIFPEGGGYGTFLHGKVVDMLYFPLVNGYFPEWFPIWGGEYFEFFRPVFNVADTAISVGIGMIIVFQKRYFKTIDKKVEESDTETESEAIPETKTVEDKDVQP